MRCIETFDSVGSWGVIRMLHGLFLPILSPVSPQDWLRKRLV
jgi:hypothetical protein